MLPISERVLPLMSENSSLLTTSTKLFPGNKYWSCAFLCGTVNVTNPCDAPLLLTPKTSLVFCAPSKPVTPGTP